MSFKKNCLLVLMVLLGCLLLFGTAALADQSMSSAERPAGLDIQQIQPPAHQPSPVKAANGGPYIDPPVPNQSGVVGVPWEYSLKPHEKGGACGAQPRILLVEDADSWATGYQNEVVLNDLGLAYDKITSDQLASTDLYQYTHLLAPSDQPQSFYDNLDANMERITQWVNDGGSFQFNACDVGWADGHWTIGPGGITHVYPVYVNQNYIQAPDHPILQGQDDSMFANWNYVSHGYFENLPEGTQVLLSVNPDGSQPTLVDFKLGKGHVVASQNTLEWSNAGAYGNPSNPLILDKIILYMFGAGFDCLQWSVSDVDFSLMNVFFDDQNTDIMKICPRAVGNDDILLTLTDTGTGATAQQWVNVKIEAEDTTPPLLEVDWPEGCLPEPGPYVLYGRVERGAENVTVNGYPVEYYNYDHFWAYWRVELYLQDGSNPVTVFAYDQAQNEARIDGNICVGVPGTDLVINAPDDCIPVGQEFTVAVEVKNVENLYGADVRLNFDPCFLEVVGEPEINTDGVFSLGGTTTVDNQVGYVAFNASRNHDDYGYEGYYGDAVLAWITFKAKQPAREGTCINFSSAELVGNEDGEGSPVYDIPINNLIKDCVCISGYALTGRVIPEAMPFGEWPYYMDYSGTKVYLEGTALVTSTDAYGNYSFINPPPGVYNVVAERGGYLTRAAEGVNIDGASDVNVDLLLLTGDITQSNVVDIDDLNVMRTDYDTWWNVRSDLDYSGWVGIRDLVYLARNYTKYGYGYLLP